MKKLLMSLAISLTLSAPPRFLSKSADSGVSPRSYTEEDIEYLESMLFTYEAIADLQSKTIKKLKKKKAPVKPAPKKRVKVRRRVKKD